MALQFSTAVRNAMLDAITAAAGAGALIKIYSGTKPADVATALSGNTLLATITGGAALAPAAAGGAMTFNATTPEPSAPATGTAAFFRLTTSGGTVVDQGTVTATGNGGDLTIATTTINATNIVTLTSDTITAPGA